MVDILPAVNPAQPNLNLPQITAQFQQRAIEQDQNPVLAFAEGVQINQRIQTNDQIIEGNALKNESAAVLLEKQRLTQKLLREQTEEDRIFNEKLQSASINEQLNVLLSTSPKIVNRNIDAANAVAARVEALGSGAAKQAIQQIYKPQYQSEIMRKDQERLQKQGFEIAKIDRRQGAIDSRQQSQIDSIEKRASAGLRLDRKKEKRLRQTALATQQIARARLGQTQSDKAEKNEARTLERSRKDLGGLLKSVRNGEESAALFGRESSRISIASRNAAGGAFELDGVRYQNERQAQQALNNRFAKFLPDKDKGLVRIPRSIQQSATLQAQTDIIPTTAKKVITKEQFESFVKSRALSEFRRIKEANPDDPRTLEDIENEIREDGLNKVELRG